MKVICLREQALMLTSLMSCPCVCGILCITICYCTLGWQAIDTEGLLCFKSTLLSVRIRLLSSGNSRLN